MFGFRRDCLADARESALRCQTCGSPCASSRKCDLLDRPYRSRHCMPRWKHAIARRWAVNRRSAGRARWWRIGRSAMSAFQARRLCPHTVIIPRIGTNTCGWVATGIT
jgi:hypothetical protein